MALTLRDGSRIRIRPIEPDDREGLADGFARLSPETRYRRFFGAMADLSERDLDYLTRVDHHHHEALVAIDDETGEGVGVARYVRIADGAAEPAVVVVDDWQGRGVGRELLSALVKRAGEEGVVRFEAPVLATNQTALRALEKIGRTEVRREGREVALTIDLPQVAPPMWSVLLREVAAGTVQPIRTLMQIIWPRRPGRPEDERLNVIIVGTSGSPSSEVAVRTAAELASPLGATVHLVGVHRFLAGHEPALVAAVRQAAESLRGQGLQVREQVRRGDAALVLSDVAFEENARMIVVGAGGRSGPARRIVGAVADMVAERAPCSVLIARPSDR
ncbi:MAG TPA: GNAT family N-acetyltransferase [Solirubrobacteraceae bacterium]|jgi:nucleotide-binding universal stress UspA family protein